MEWIDTIFLTCWTKDITQCQIQELFTRGDSIDTKYLIIGSLEYTENNLEHFHVIAKLEHTIRFSTLKLKLPNSTHIERLIRGSNAYDYITKEGVFFSNFEEKLTNKDIYDNIMSEIIFGIQLTEIIKNHPKFALLHYEKLEKVYNAISPNIKK